MNIKTSNELQEAINLAISGNKSILYDIARYIAYNYYFYTHIKKGSETDIKNEEIYRNFEENHYNLWKEVEEMIDQIYDNI